MALARYEFLNEFHLRDKVLSGEKEELAALKGVITPEDDSGKPQLIKEADDEIKRWSAKQEKAGMKRTGDLGRVWLVRRPRDAKLFLAREFRDPEKILEVAGTAMMRLLNHPNLVRLIDIVKKEQLERELEYMVWEYCSRGTLRGYLATLDRKDGFPVRGPESLCWHVLEGISAALCWLHNGIKLTFPFDRHMRHDDDWHTLLVGDIHPSNIFFSNPKPGERCGLVKLGCFTSSRVCLNPGLREAAPEFEYGRSLYWPLEIVQGREMWSPSAEIWSLGVVIWTMMTGKPPRLQEVTRSGATVLDYDCNVMTLIGYSKMIRDVLSTILSPSPRSRPTSLELLHKVIRTKALLDESLQAGADEQNLRRASSQSGMPKIFGNLDILFDSSDKKDNEPSNGWRNTASARDSSHSFPTRARTDCHANPMEFATALTPRRPLKTMTTSKSNGKNPDWVAFLVHGIVQGVNFRDLTQRRTRSHSLLGGVRNIWDGKVHGETQGEERIVQKLLKEIDIGGGPPHANVDKLEKEIDVIGGERTFEARR